MKYRIKPHVVEAWQMPTVNLDTASEIVPTPIWVFHYLTANPTVSPRHWLVKSSDNIETWTNTAFIAAYEPDQEPTIEPPPTEELFDWIKAKEMMRSGIKIARCNWPATDHIEWDENLNQVVGAESSGGAPRADFTPFDTTSKVWRVWTEPAKPTEEPLEPFDWNDAEHLLKAGHKIRKNGWKPGIFISMSEGKPRLWRNGTGEPFQPSDASLKIWILA